MKTEKFTEIWLENDRNHFYCLLEFCLVTGRHYLMFRWPVQIAKLRKLKEI